MTGFIILMIVVGFIAGLVARVVVPGRHRIGIIGTTVLGLAGSFVGGFLWQLAEFHKIETTTFRTTGIIGSIVGAVVVLFAMRLTGLEGGRRRRLRRLVTPWHRS